MAVCSLAFINGVLWAKQACRQSYIRSQFCVTSSLMITRARHVICIRISNAKTSDTVQLSLDIERIPTEGCEVSELEKIENMPFMFVLVNVNLARNAIFPFPKYYEIELVGQQCLTNIITPDIFR